MAVYSAGLPSDSSTFVQVMKTMISPHWDVKKIVCINVRLCYEEMLTQKYGCKLTRTNKSVNINKIRFTES